MPKVNPQDVVLPTRGAAIPIGTSPAETRAGRAETRAEAQLGLSIEAAQRAAAAQEKALANLTEGQAKAVGWYQRARSSNVELSRLNLPPAGLVKLIAYNSSPVFASQISNDKEVAAFAAIKDFINATLRQDSGAAIGPNEFEAQFQIYFPNPNAGPKEIEQKRRARELAIRSLATVAGTQGKQSAEANLRELGYLDKDNKPIETPYVERPTGASTTATEQVGAQAGYRFPPEVESDLISYVNSAGATEAGIKERLIRYGKQYSGSPVDENFAAETAKGLMSRPIGQRAANISYAASDTALNTQLDAINAANAAAAQQAGLPVRNPQEQMLTEGLSLGGGGELAGFGAGIGNLMRGGQYGPAYDIARAAEERRLQQIQSTTPNAEALKMAGFLASAIPFTRAVGGVLPESWGVLPTAVTQEAALAGTQGALGAEPNQRLQTGAASAVLAPLTVGALSGATKLGGTLVSGLKPEFTQSSRRLIEQGVQPTTGQILREYATRSTMAGKPSITAKMAANAEDRFTGLPILGDILGTQRTAAELAAQQASGRLALRPIGEEANITQAGSPMINEVETPISDAYDKMDVMRLTFDRPFLRSVRNLNNRISRLPNTERTLLDNVLNNAIISRFGQNNTLTGRQLRDLSEVFYNTRSAINAPKTGAPTDILDTARAAKALDEIEASIFNLARRKDPQNYAMWRNANEAYKRGKTVTEAAYAAKNRAGMPYVPTPAQLGTQVDLTRRRGYGQTPLTQLSEDINIALPSQTGTSGTSERGSMADLLAGGLTGIGGLSMGGLPFTRTGQNIGRQLLVGNRLPEVANAGQLIQAGSRDISQAAIPAMVEQVNQYNAPTPEEQAAEQERIRRTLQLNQIYVAPPAFRGNPYAQ